MSTIVAIVKSLVGQVFAVSLDGLKRQIFEGERVLQGEQVLTGLGGEVTLQLANGEVLSVAQNSNWQAGQAEPADSAQAPASELEQAIAAGLDPTTELEATAAGAGTGGGAGGAAGGGHSFVMLDETGGQLEAEIGFETSGVGLGGSVQDEVDGLTGETGDADPVDPVEPVNPAAPSLNLLVDSGVADDLITNNGSYSIGGVEPGATVEYSTDGTTWSTTPPVALEGRNTILVRQTDVAGNTSPSSSLTFTLDTTASITVSLDDVNSANVANAPISGTSDVGPGRTVTLTITDANGNTVTTTAITGTDGNYSTTADLSNLADGGLSVTASVTDIAGNSASATDGVSLLDTNLPALVISAADSNLAAGESTTITFQFSEAVSGFELGDVSVAGGSLSNFSQVDADTWTATFTQSGSDTPSISVANDQYTDLAGNNGSGDDLTLAADTTAPTLVISAADSNLAAGESTTITFQFSEAVSGFDASDVTVAGGSLSNFTQVDADTWTATFTQSGSDTPSISVANDQYTDLAGNNGSGDDLTLAADTPAPTLVISAADSNLAAGESTTITFQFSEAVAGFDASDVTVAGGSLSDFTQVDADTWTATFTQSGSDTPSISVANDQYTDLAGNNGSGDDLTLAADTTAPTLVISAADSNLAAGESTTITFQFSEAVAGFDASDVTVAGGSLSDFTQVDADTWTATFTQSGSDTPSISVANDQYTDLAGNNGSGDELTLAADTTAPTLVISAADSNLAAGESTTITFQFSEAVAGFDASDVTVAGGSLSNFTQVDADTWTATFTQSGSGDDLPLAAAATTPTLALTPPDGLPAAGESTTITFQFSEAVAGFDASD